MHPVDARIRSAVWIVLAGTSACQHAQHPVPLEPAPTAPEPSNTVGTASGGDAPVGVASAGPGDAGAGDARVVLTVARPPDPDALCRAYRARTPAPAVTLHPAFAELRELGAYDEALPGTRSGDTVSCELVLGRTETRRTVMVASSCCGKVRSPCPPHPENVRRVVLNIERVVLADDGTVKRTLQGTITSDDIPPQHPCGRRPEGFAPSASTDAADAADLGRTFAAMAELEAASVHAFARLADELLAMGAPDDLVARARVAQDDEVRHARMMGHLAERHGAGAPAPPRPAWSPRSAVEMARENAVEGCVFETFGAALATFQAARSTEPDLRAVFERIAEDERAHAALAWDVHEWLAPRLTEAERSYVQSARTDAARRLHADLARGNGAASHDGAADAMGSPSRKEARALASLCFA